MAKLFIWDFDGVIANTPHEEAWSIACKVYGITGFDHDFYENFVSGFTNYEGSKNILEKLLHLKDIANKEKIILDFSNLKSEIYFDLLKQGKYSLNYSVLQFLKKSRYAGILQALASASDPSLIDALFQREGLKVSELFDINVSGAGKTKTEIFSKAFDIAIRMHGKIETVFVFEDAPIGVTAGKSLGYIVIGCFNRSLKKYGADLIVEDFSSIDLGDILILK
ncbi:MAG TPA: HAD family phosphatase [Geobacterales bacterium]|nr:HAD family phosphatase [Geobacterales bacterium]